jgi:DMSO/TMAO reductase YedYZ heme-binding membrane subunit
MPRWETLTALAAVVAACLAALHTPWRLWFEGAAIVLLAIVCAAELQRYLSRNAR